MLEWLPDLLDLNGSSVRDDYAKLYEIFCRDFVDDVPEIDGDIVFFEGVADRQDMLYPQGFTHLVTHDDGTGRRFIDYGRACRLPWVRAVIDNRWRNEVSVFWAKQANPKYGIVDNLYLWLEQEEFVVILRRVTRGKMCGKMLITAYNTEVYTSKKLRKLRGKYGK